MDTGDEIKEQTPLTKRISVYVGTLAALCDYPDNHTNVVQVFSDAMMDYVKELETNSDEYDMGRAIATIDKLFEAGVTASTSVKLPVYEKHVDTVLVSEIKKRKITRV